jgi:hypothetical protein
MFWLAKWINKFYDLILKTTWRFSAFMWLLASSTGVILYTAPQEIGWIKLIHMTLMVVLMNWFFDLIRMKETRDQSRH